VVTDVIEVFAYGIGLTLGGGFLVGPPANAFLGMEAFAFTVFSSTAVFSGGAAFFRSAAFSSGTAFSRGVAFTVGAGNCSSFAGWKNPDGTSNTRTAREMDFS
jgi:hypothetical protein